VSKSRVAITAGAVFLSAALAVVFLQGPTSEPSIDAEQLPIQTPVSIPTDLPASKVLTWNCEIETHKPEMIFLTCADGGLYVEKIKWSTWTKDGATGSGIFSENLCEPSCAEGQRVEAQVNLNLTNLTEQNGKYFLRTLDISTLDGKDFSWGKTKVFQWDVMEFAERMKKGIEGE
jgi:hypothetical protein